uniref:Uncharacterized protein n=1 Tax=Photinus pyralis TaxID=7054 RepID=A0A1Y1MHN2_PHOPY
MLGFAVLDHLFESSNDVEKVGDELGSEYFHVDHFFGHGEFHEWEDDFTKFVGEGVHKEIEFLLSDDGFFFQKVDDFTNVSQISTESDFHLHGVVEFLDHFGTFTSVFVDHGDQVFWGEFNFDGLHQMFEVGTDVVKGGHEVDEKILEGETEFGVGGVSKTDQFLDVFVNGFETEDEVFLDLVKVGHFGEKSHLLEGRMDFSKHEGDLFEDMVTFNFVDEDFFVELVDDFINNNSKLTELPGDGLDGEMVFWEIVAEEKSQILNFGLDFVQVVYEFSFLKVFGESKGGLESQSCHEEHCKLCHFRSTCLNQM